MGFESFTYTHLFVDTPEDEGDWYSLNEFFIGADSNVQAEHAFIAAYAAHEVGDLDRAISLYPLSSEEHQFEANFNLGQIHRKAKRLNQAKECFLFCYQKDPSDSYITGPLAVTLRALNAHEEAEQLFRRGFELGCHDSFDHLIYSLEKQEKFVEMKELYERSLGVKFCRIDFHYYDKLLAERFPDIQRDLQSNVAAVTSWTKPIPEIFQIWSQLTPAYQMTVRTKFHYVYENLHSISSLHLCVMKSGNSRFKDDVITIIHSFLWQL